MRPHIIKAKREVHDLRFTPDGNTLISHGTAEKLPLWEAVPSKSASAEK